MNTRYRKHVKKLLRLLAGLSYSALLLGTLPADLFAAPALPTGSSVVSGSATISQTGANHLQIDQSSRAAIINWGGFSIGRDAGVHFANGSGATLNRVTGALPSRIDGSLTATGSVYLINQAGVVVGSEGRVDTGGSFVASTHDVADAAFLGGGDLLFSGNSDSVIVNAGKIGSLGGDVALIARRVENTGSLTAPQGTATLAAGYEVLVRDYAHNDGKFIVRIGGPDTTVLNSGVIEAAAAELRANGGNIYALAGNTEGIIKATNLDLSGGRIVFDAGSTGTVELTGKIDASSSSSTGGLVIATGDKITVKNGATLDASGSSGGKILLGGDYQGGIDAANNFATHTLATATTTTVESGSLLRADGIAGDGGKIVVWADGLTSFAGYISSRGGNIVGNGGFAEVSGKALLDYRGLADLRAPAGQAGTLLLDPYNITISDSNTARGSFANGVFTPSGTSSILNADDLIEQLELSNVLVTTGGEGSAGTQNGDILVNAFLEWESGNNLELSAYRNITVNNDINAGAGSVILRADNSGTGTGTVSFGDSVITATGGVSIYFNPSVNPVGSGANDTSYANPTEIAFWEHVNTEVATPLTAYMLVNTVYDLQNIKNNVGGWDSAGEWGGGRKFAYALSKDIDASDTINWNSGSGFLPIGSGSYNMQWFTTTLDGQGHVISDLFIRGNYQYLAFIQGTQSSAVVRNIGLIDPYVESLRPATQGLAALIAWANGGIYENVFVSNATILESQLLTSNNISGSIYYGVGALIGNLESGWDGNATLKNAWATGSVAATPFPVAANRVRRAIGGLVGSVGTGVTIDSVYSNAHVVLLGNANDHTKVGRLFGNFGGSVGSLTNAYYNTERTLQNYRDEDSTGGIGIKAEGVAGIALTDAQAADKASFTGFDFDKVWNEPLAGSFPTLKDFTGTYDFGLADAIRVITYEFDRPSYSWIYGDEIIPINVTLHGVSEADKELVGINFGYQGYDSAYNQIVIPFTSLTNVNTQTGYNYIYVGGLTGDIKNTRKYILNQQHSHSTTPVIIGKAPLTVQVKDVVVAKDGTINLTMDDAIITGALKNGDTITKITFTQNANTANPGTYALTVPSYNGLTFQRDGVTVSANNYELTIIPGTLTVQANPIRQNVSYNFGDDPLTWVYGQGGLDYLLSALNLTGIDSADQGKVSANIAARYGLETYFTDLEITPRLDARSGTNAYYIVVSGFSGESAGKYQIDHAHSTPGRLTVTPAPLHIELNNISKAYNEELGSYGYAYVRNDAAALATWVKSMSGILDGDIIDGANFNSSGFLATAGGGDYQITISTLISGSSQNSNYAITSVTGGKLTVTGAPPTATLKPVTYDFGSGTYTWEFGDTPGTITWTLGGVDATDKDKVTGVLGVYNSYGYTTSLSATMSAGDYTLRIASLTGEKAAGYGIATEGNTPGQLTVTKAPLTITANDVSKNSGEYWAFVSALSAINATYDGLKAGHTPTSLAVTLASAGSAKEANPGVYEIAITPIDPSYNSNAANYDITYVSGRLTVLGTGSETMLTYDFGNSPFSWVYGSDNRNLITWTLDGVNGSDDVKGVLAIANAAGVDVTLAALLNAGSYTLSLSGLTGENAGNYLIDSVNSTNGSLTVTRKQVSIGTQGSVSNRVYNGLLSANVTSNGGFTLGDLVEGGDHVELKLAAAYGDKNVGTGKAITGTYSLIGAGAGNYELTGDTSFSGTASVTVRDLSIGINGTIAEAKIYDGLLGLGVLTHGELSGLIGGDAVTLTLADVVFADKNVGTGKAVTGLYAISGADAGNYTLSGTAFSGIASITPKALTFTATSTVADKVYDGTLAATLVGGDLAGTLNGLIDGDTVLYTLSGLAFADKNVGIGKTVNGTIALSGADANNYTFEGAAFSGNASITPKTLTLVSAGNVADKVYDGTTDAIFSGSQFDGVITGDQVTIGLTGGFADKNVGTDKAVTGTYNLAGVDALNYTLVGGGSFSGTASITVKELNIGTQGTVSNKTYDGFTAAVAATHGVLSGLITGDTVELTLGNLAFASKNVGEGRGVTGTYTIGGTDAGNYNLAGAAFIGIASITPKQITLGTQGTVAASKIYDGTTMVEVLTQGLLTGLVDGDAVTLALTAAYADKNVGASKSISGSYAISGADAGNYTLAGNAFTGTAAITAKALTLTSAGTVTDKIYDGTTGATILGAAFSGLVGSDVVTLGLTGGFADKNVGQNKTVTGAYSLTGADAGNYTLSGGTTFSGTASITAKALSIGTQGTVSNKTYDGTSSATAATHGILSGLITGDAVNLILGSLAFASKNAGSQSVTGLYTIAGTDVGNYTLAGNAFTGTATISAKQLSIGTQGTVANKTYDGTTAATATTNGVLAGLIGSDAVNLTLGNLGFASKNAGSQSVTGTYAISGADAGNYTLAGSAFSGTASITPKEITLGTQGTVAASKVYDGTTVIEILTQGSLAGLIGSDAVNLALTAAYADQNAGADKTVSGNYALSGADAGNYTLADASFAATAAIEKAVLSYAANAATRVQGQANPILSGAVTGFVAGETLASATTGSLTWTSPADTQSAPGSYAINGGGLEAQNYALTQAAANATALTVTAVPVVPVKPTAPWVPSVDEVKELITDNPAFEEKTAAEIAQIASAVVEQITVIVQTPNFVEGGSSTASQENSAARVQSLVNEAAPAPAPGSLTSEPANNGVDSENLRQFGPFIRVSSL